MGFDLGGLAPENEDGECFDTDISGWMALAEYVLFTCDDLFLEGETECWFSNDGQVVSAETARAIGERLQKLIAKWFCRETQGRVLHKIRSPKNYFAALEPIFEKNSNNCR